MDWDGPKTYYRTAIRLLFNLSELSTFGKKSRKMPSALELTSAYAACFSIIRHIDQGVTKHQGIWFPSYFCLRPSAKDQGIT